MIKTGKIELSDNTLFLAPMENITDYSFRHMCKENGADIMISEFIASEGLIRDCEKSFKKMKIEDSERPFGVQLYGPRTEAMVEATKKAEETRPDFIDLNFGCPAKKIANRGAGAGLLQNVPLMIEMAEAIVKATDLPVTAKIRIGWDHNHINVLEVAKKLQEAGIQLLTIHGRTKSQMYQGKADWETIASVKHHPDIFIPIVGNGDIQTPEDAKKAFEYYQVDGVMIGRATVGKPWLFKQIKHYLIYNELIEEPSIEEKVEIARKHLKKSIEWKGYPRGIYEMRRHLSNYFKGLPNFKKIKRTLVTSLDEQELMETLDYIAEKYADFDSTLLPGNNFFHY